LGIAVGNDGGLECLMVFGVFRPADDRLGGEPMADGITAGALFAFDGVRSGAFARIAAVGFDFVGRTSLRACRCDWVRFVISSPGL
jgi:hypothetical protein